MEIEIYQPTELFGYQENSTRSRVLLVANDPSNNLYCARRVHGEQVDFQLLRRWVSMCEEGHKDCSSPTIFEQTERRPVGGNVHELKVVDILHRRIVTAPVNCRCAALSYVWGNGLIQFQTNSSNLDAISSMFGLPKFEEQMPQTIKDAINIE